MKTLVKIYQLKHCKYFYICFSCDCFSSNDLAIVPDIGIAASFDPVALDKASVDLVNKAPIIAGSILTDKHYHEGEDKFNHIHMNTNWETGLKHGEELGMGTLEYELVRV